MKGDYPLAVGKGLLYKKPKPKKEEVPVTVCIAAKCAEGVIFLASDRMITAGDIQFQPPSPKILAFTSSIFIMTAGDSAFQTEIINEAHYAINRHVTEQPTEWWLVKDVVDVYIKYRNLAKLRRSESAILAPLGLDKDSFLEKLHLFPSELCDKITKELINYDVPGIAAIITGIDKLGPHIYVVSDNNQGAMDISCMDKVGFASIGSGSRHAESQFMLAGHSHASSLSEALLLTYSAKKRAEIAPGVGPETDMWVIGPSLGSSSSLNDEIFKRLDVEYNKLKKAEDRVLNKARKEVDHFVTEIRKAAAQKEQTSPPTDGGKTPTDTTTVPESA